MKPKIDRAQLEPEAAELHRQGMSLRRVTRELRARYGDGARGRSTYQEWAKQGPDLWTRSKTTATHSPEEQHSGEEASLPGDPQDVDISVAADIARLRHVRRRIDALLDRAEALSAAEGNELKILLKVEEDLQRRTDPERMLDWLERFVRWAAEKVEPQDRECIAAVARSFGEHVFGAIEAAAPPGGPSI